MPIHMLLLRPCAGPWPTTWTCSSAVAPSMPPWICGSCRPLELSWVMDKRMRAAPASLLAWHCKGKVNMLWMFTCPWCLRHLGSPLPPTLSRAAFFALQVVRLQLLPWRQHCAHPHAALTALCRPLAYYLDM